MKLSDLVVGQDYALSVGKWEGPLRCVVLDKRPMFKNASGWKYPLHHPDDAEVRTWYSGGRGTGRFLVAVETTATYLGLTKIIPYAARPQEIVEPWGPYAEKLAQHEAEAARRQKVFEEQREQARLEAERKAEERRISDEADQLEYVAQRAANLGRFDAEVAPVINALGGRCVIERSYGRASMIEVDLGTLAELCQSLRPGSIRY